MDEKLTQEKPPRIRIPLASGLLVGELSLSASQRRRSRFWGVGKPTQESGQNRRFKRQPKVSEGDVWLVDVERATPRGGNGARLGKRLRER
jgi:hypothetical protein